MHTTNPTTRVVSTSQPPLNRVVKANNQTAAAKWNRQMLKRLGTALSQNPEVDLAALLPISYSDKLQMHKTSSLSAFTQPPSKPSYPNDDLRSCLGASDPITILFEPTANLQELIGNRSDLSATLVDLLAESKVIYKGIWALSVMVLQINDGMIVKVTNESTSATTEYHSLAYIQSHLPSFPAPKPHGLVRLGRFHLLFMSLIPGQDLEHAWPELNDAQKQNVSSQIDELLLELRSLPPSGAQLGDVEGGGCKDARRATRVNSEPIWDAEQFQDFVFAGSRTHSTVYNGLLRQLRPASAKCVFTHGDLRPANIMADRSDDGDWRVVGLIDWEASGFYPEYWECVKMTNNLSPTEDFDWYKYLPKSVSHQQYPIEWLVDRLLDPTMVNS
ncbi:kinase-like domain-containing protein [Xylaria palmicola]|nr:kinase-like domain-containing protein [Xylaria palmicola]